MMFSVFGMSFLSGFFCHSLVSSNKRLVRQVPDPDSETFSEPRVVPDSPGSIFALEAEIAKRIRQGEASDLSPGETGTVLNGLAGSLGLGLAGEAINDIIGAKLPFKDERTE